jgi:hypothetical protein
MIAGDPGGGGGGGAGNNSSFKLYFPLVSTPSSAEAGSVGTLHKVFLPAVSGGSSHKAFLPAVSGGSSNVRFQEDWLNDNFGSIRAVNPDNTGSGIRMAFISDSLGLIEDPAGKRHALPRTIAERVANSGTNVDMDVYAFGGRASNDPEIWDSAEAVARDSSIENVVINLGTNDVKRMGGDEFRGHMEGLVNKLHGKRIFLVKPPVGRARNKYDPEKVVSDIIPALEEIEENYPNVVLVDSGWGPEDMGAAKDYSHPRPYPLLIGAKKVGWQIAETINGGQIAGVR